MNYSTIYFQFIENRRCIENNIKGYSEKHHIIPKSRYGSNDPRNIIKLSAKDHIHAHILLAKIYGGSMWYAISYMVNHPSKNRRIPTKMLIKAAAFNISSRKHHSEQTKRKMSDAAIGKPKSDAMRAKMVTIAKNRVLSPEHLEKLVSHGKSFKGKKQSIDTRRKRKMSNLGKKLSTGHCKKISNSQKGEKGHFYGKKHSNETICKMKRARAYIKLWYELLGIKNKKSSLAVKVKCTTTNEIFNSYSEAGTHFKMKKETVKRLIAENRPHATKRIKFIVL